MDMITLAMVNGLKRDGGAGYSESGKVYTYDGKSEELAELVPGLVHAKIATHAPSLTTIIKAVATFPDGSQGELTAEKLIIDVNSLNETASFQMGTQTIPFAILDKQTGEDALYVLSMADTAGYCSSIEFGETVHPIDPKFLPHTVVDITDIMTALRDAGNASINISPDDELGNAFANAIIKGIETKTLVLEERRSDGAKFSFFPVETMTLYEENNATGEWLLGYKVSFCAYINSVTLASCDITIMRTQTGQCNIIADPHN